VRHYIAALLCCCALGAVEPMASTGNEHSLYLADDGTVWAWGLNSSGQLGDGTTTLRVTPVRVQNLDNVVQVSAGYSHSAALRADGTVWVWGSNAYGQRGDGTTGGTVTSPVQVPGLSGVRQISSGGFHILALLADGSARGWGYNGTGCVGNGTTTSPLASPAVVAGGHLWRMLAGGGLHSVGLRADGTVWTWGYDFDGQLGDDVTISSKSAPVQVSGLSSIIHVGAGYSHSLAVGDGGTLYGWGDNASGQVESGTTAPTDQLVPVVLSASVVERCFAGHSHTIATRSNDITAMFGRNSEGQCRATAAAIKTPSTNVGGLRSLATGFGNHTVAILADGRVQAWGNDSAGQLGDGTSGGISDVAVTVVAAWSAGRPMSVARGQYHGLALLSDGTAWAWGANSSGQAGNGGSGVVTVPAQVQQGTARFDAIATGGDFGDTNLALTGAGKVWGWGANASGQTGDGTTTTPKTTPAATSYATAVRSIGAGDYHGLMVNYFGNALAWGQDSLGQLGNDATLADSLSAVSCSGVNTAIAVGGGRYFSLALLADGTLRSWGDDAQGQLGNDASFTASGVPVTVSLPIGVRITAIAVGGYHGLALCSDGRVLAWGLNGSGQLGDGTTTNRPTPVYVRANIIADLTNVVAIAAGANHSLAILSNGTVRAWGANGQYELGDGTTTQRNYPVSVGGLGNIVAIEAGYGGSVALRADGTVWCWGANSTYQVGNGNTAVTTAPTQTTGAWLPTVTIATADGTASEAGANTASFTVTRTGPTTGSLTVLYAPSGSASAGSDYQTPTGSVTIPAGSASATVVVTPIDDAVDENTETITLTISSDAAAYQIGATNSATANLEDDDTAGITVNPTSGLVINEAGATSATFTVVLTSQPTASVSIGVSSLDTTEGTVSPTSLTFTASNWSTAQTVTVTAVNDALDDGNVLFTVQTANAASSDPNYNNRAVADVTATCVDDDTRGIVLSKSTLAVTEGGATDTYSVRLASEPTGTVTVTLGSSPSSEVSLSTTTLTFTGGAGGTWNSPQNVTVTAVNDDLDEDRDLGTAEAVTISHSASGGDYAGQSGTATANVSDNDQKPSLAISGGNMVLEATGAVMPFTVTMTRKSDVAISVNYSYYGASGPVTSVSTTLSAPIGSGDATVTLASVAGLTPKMVLRIGSEDLLVTAVAGSTATVTRGANGTTPAAYGAGTAVEFGDFVKVSGTLTWDPETTGAKVFNVPVLNDTLYEGDEYLYYQITSQSPTNAATIPAAPNAYIWGYIRDTTDPMPSLAFTSSGSTIAENGGSATVTAQLSEVSGSWTYVNLGFTGDALRGQVYINEETWDGPTQITDAFYAADETVIGLGSLDGIAAGTVLVTIYDEKMVVQSIDTVLGIVTVLRGQLGTTAQAFYFDDGPLRFGDLRASSEWIYIDPGQLSGSVTVTAEDDAIDEADETATIGFASLTGASAGAPASYTLTVTDDDDPPTVQFSVASLTRAEGSGSATLTVTKSHRSERAVTVPYAITGTAAGGTDYTIPASPLVIPAGADSATIVVTISNDALDEDDETVILTIGSPTNATVGGIGALTLTIGDDDATPTVTFTSASQSKDEDDGTATITAQLSAISGRSVSIPFTTGGLAVIGTDVGYAPASPLIIPAGSTTGTITVSILEDDLYEGDETATVSMTTGSIVNATGSGTTVHTLTITDNDAKPIVAISDVNVTETDAGTVTATVTVTMTGKAGVTLTFNYATSDGSATIGGGDYSTASGLLAWTPGTTGAKTFAVTVNSDNISEGDETIATALTITAPSVPFVNAGLSDLSGVVTINDDDVPGLSVAPTTLAVTEGGTADVITVALNTVPASAVTVTVSADAQTELSLDGTDWSTPTAVSFQKTDASTQQIHIRGKNDAVYEGSHVGTVTTAVTATVDGDYTGKTGAPVVVTITDDEIPPTVSIVASSNAAEGTADTVVNLAVTLSHASAFPVNVNFATVAGTATAAADYTASSGVVSFAALATSQSTAVTIKADALDEDDETVAVVLSNPLGATLGADTCTITIQDNADDQPPSVAFALASSSQAESVGAVNVLVQLSAASGRAVTVPFSASFGADASLSASPLVFPAGTTQLNVAVSVLDDAIVEGTESFGLSIGTPTNATLGAQPGHTFEITDNDTGAILIDTGNGVLVAEDTGNSDAGTSDSYSVVLSAAPSGNVTITLTPDDQATVSPTTLTFTTANWNQAQTVVVTRADDLVDEGADTVAAAHNTAIAYAVAGPGTYQGLSGSTPGKVIDDDDAAIVVQTAADFSTTEAGGTTTFSVVLTSRPVSNVTITVASGDTGECTVSPSSLLFTPADWNDAAAHTVTITGVNDDYDDGDVSVGITLSTPTGDAVYAALPAPTVSNATNRDDDARGVTVTPAGGLTVTETGGQAVILVKLNSRPTNDAAVTIPFSSGQPAEASLSPASLTFTSANWNQYQAVIVTGLDDLVDDGDQVFEIDLATATGAASDYVGFDTPNLPITCVDNDARAVVIGLPGGAIALDEAAAATTGSYTVALATRPGGDVVVTATADAQLEISIDGTTWASALPLTFTTADWSTAQAVLVRPVDDLVAEAASHPGVVRHVVTTAPVGDAYAGLIAGDLVASVADDDTAGFEITAISGDTTEAGGSATVQMRLLSRPAANVVVVLTSSDTSEGTVAPSSVSFAPDDWNVFKTITVTGANDALPDGTIGYQIVTAQALSNDIGYNGLDPADIAVDNLDDDAAGIQVVVAGGITTTTEAGGAASIQVSLSAQPTADVTIDLVSSDVGEGAIAGASGSPPTLTLTFTSANWSTVQTVTVTGVDDNDVDGDQAYSIQFDPSASADPVFDGLDPADIAFTNTDNDTAGFTIAAASPLVVGEAGTSATFTVRLNSRPTADVTIAVTNPDASEFAVSPASLTFTTTDWNDAGAHTVTVTGVDDAVADGAITATIALGADATTADTDYQGLDPADVTARCDDNDVIGIEIDNPGLAVGEGGATDTYRMRLQTDPGNGINVVVTLSGGSQITLSSTTLTFTGGGAGTWSDWQTVTVSAVNDAVAEGAHGATITHAVAGGGYTGITVPNQAVDIADNDSAGVTVSPTAGLVTTESGGTASFTVVLTSQPTADVRVFVDNDRPDQDAASTGVLTFTTANWNQAQTVTLTGLADDLDDGDIAHSIELSITSTDPVYAAIDPADVSVTAQDDDTAGVVASPAAIATDETGSAAEIAVRLATRPSATVTVSVAVMTTGGPPVVSTEASASPTTLTFTVDDWSTPQTVTVTGLDDATDDGDQPYRVAIAADGAYGNLTASVDGANADDDGVGVLMVQSAGSTNVVEGGASDAVSIRLLSAPTATVTIALSPDAQVSVDAPTLTFTAGTWSTPQTVTITAIDDAVAEGSHTGSVAFAVTSADAGYNGLPMTGLQATVTDDDTAGLVLSRTSGLATSESGAGDSTAVRLNSQPTADVTIAVADSPAGEVSWSPATLTFTAANWNVPQNLQFTGVDDDLDDGDRAVTATLTATSADGQYGGRTAAVGITNQDDDAVGVSASPTSLVTTEVGGTATCQVRLACEPTATVTVTWTITEVGERDEFAVWTGTFDIAPGSWSVPVPITLTGADDGADDGHRTATLRIVCSSGDSSFQGLLVDVPVTNLDDDDPALLISLSDAEATEGGGSATLRVRLASAPTAAVTVSVAGGSQLTAPGGTLAFDSMNWDQLQDVILSATDDAVAEGLHSGVATISASGGDYAGLSATATVAITDDDAAGIVVTPTAGLETTELGGEATFTVVLSSQPVGQVRINLNSSAPGQGILMGGSGELTFDATNWDDPQTVTVRGQDGNQYDDGNVPYQVLIQPATSTDPNYSGRDADDVSLVNRSLNNPPTVNNPPNNIPFSEDEAAKTVTLTGLGVGQAGENQTLSITVDDSGVSAFLGVALSYTAPASEGVLTLTPVADLSGTGSIVVTISDGVGADDIVRTIAVEVIARNDTPELVVDGVDTLALGGTLAIRGSAGNPASQLRVIASDVETATGSLTCHIPLRPNLGRLMLDGVELVNGSSFPYQDLLDGHLSYVHNGLLSGEDGFALEIEDGGQGADGPRSEVAIITLTISGLTPPQVTIDDATPAAWTEGDGPVRLDGSAQVQDFDSPNFNGGSITVAGATARTGDRIAVDTGLVAGLALSGNQIVTSPGGVALGTISGGSDATPLSISLTADCTPSLAQGILSALTWTNIGDNPGADPDTPETRTLTITVADGSSSTPAPVQRRIAVDPVDDLPTMTATTIALTPGLTVTVQLTAADPEGETVSFAAGPDPSYGTATVQVDGTVTYQHQILDGLVDAIAVTLTEAGAGGQVANASVDVLISAPGPGQPRIVSPPPVRAEAGTLFVYTPVLAGFGSNLQCRLVPALQEAQSGTAIGLGTYDFTTATGTLRIDSPVAPADGGGYLRAGILVIDRDTGRSAYQPILIKIAPGAGG
jgi:alpha-tubulin suppressor-like RCC1 family protein